jgi:nodulation protein E
VTRVAITGLGAVSALGVGVPALWDGVSTGRSGVRRIEAFDPTKFLSQIAAEVPGWSPAQYWDETQREMLDRFTQFALVAAEEAWSQAGLGRLDEAARDRAGTSIASALGGAVTQDERYEKMYGKGGTRPHPFSIPRIMSNAGAAHVSMKYGLRGPALSFSTACAASAHAIGEASEIIRSGRADVMLAGGADAPIAPGVVRCWEAMRVLAPGGTEPARA